MKKKSVMPPIPKDMPCSICGGDGKTCNICGEGPSACGCDEAEIEEYVEEYGDQFDTCESCQEKP